MTILPEDLTIEWHSDEPITWTHDGYKFSLTFEIDEYPDLSYLGTFSAHNTLGALAWDLRNDRTFDWFVPSSTVRDLVKQGVGHSDACKHVRELRERMEAFVSGDVAHLTLTVTCQRAGVELGFGCIGGVESDGDDEYFRTLAEELSEEAYEEAENVICTLIKERS